MSLLHIAGGATEDKLYVEDVFSTYLYTGNGATQTINNGIDLAGEGGMVWAKCRSTAYSNYLQDTVRGIGNVLISTATDASGAYNLITGVGSSGFSLSSDISTNANLQTYASWTFRKAPKFFDVVTYTGDGVSGRQIPHSLGIAAGMVICKNCTTAGYDWGVWHRSLGTRYFLNLNLTSAKVSSTLEFPVDADASVFTVGVNENQSGATYVAYLFAHDPSADGIIQCGSFTTDGSGNAAVNLGWEPQYIMYKASSTTSLWYTLDNMRGMPNGGTSNPIYPNSSATEASSGVGLSPINLTPTGFNTVSGGFNSTGFIYLAIRRGNKTPTSGTEVFQPIVYTGTNADNRLVNTTIAPDMVMVRERNDTTPLGMAVASRLTGDARLQTSSTAAELGDADSFMTPTVGYGNSFSAMNGFGVGNDATCKVNADTTANNHIALAFKRAKGFFDVVCYTGTAVARTVNHNLGVAPELMIVKMRNAAGYAFMVYVGELGATKNLRLNSTVAQEIENTTWGNTAPSEYVFTVDVSFHVNQSGRDYVAYLFATLAGVSKVGSYTGNGTTQTINCGFSSGARFILIKRTDSTGDWYVWDTVRGIVAANDPHLSLNTTSVEVTTDDSVDPESSGFIVNQLVATNINVNGGSYIFLAIA